MKKPVAIRELKTHLSKYLKKVRRGEVVTVSDRGKVIAEIHPVDSPPEKEALFKLEGQGLISWNGLKPLGTEKPLPSGGRPIEDYVSEGRR